MAGNFFDQYDKPAAAPAQGGSGAGGSNFFDQFDGPDRGLSGDVKAGIAHAGVSLREQAGNAENYLGRVANAAGDATGSDTLHSIGDHLTQGGMDMAQSAQADENQGNTLGYNGQNSTLRRNAYGVADMGTQMAVVGGTGAAAGAAAGASVGALFGGVGAIPGAAAGAILGWGIANVAALPALLGLGQAGATANQVEAADMKAGKTDAEAKSDALTAGAATGAVTAGGAAVLGALGPLAKAVGGAAVGSVVETALTATAKDVAIDTAKAAGVGGLANAGTTAAVQGTENAYGVGDGPTAGGLVDSALQGVAITGLAHAPGAALHAQSAAKTAGVLGDPTASPVDRQKAALGAMGLIASRDPALAKDFGIYAANQIAYGLPVEIGNDRLYTKFSEDQQTQADAQAAQANRTTGDTFPSFTPTGDEAAANAPGFVNDPNVAAPNGPTVGGDASMRGQDINQPMPDDLRAPAPAAPAPAPVAQSAPPTITDTIGTIMHAGSVDDAIAATEQSTGRGLASTIDTANKIGLVNGVVTPAGAEVTPTPENLATDRDYYQNQANAAQQDMRNQAFDATQQPAPAVPADAFAQRQAQLDAAKQQTTNAAYQQNTLDKLATPDAQKPNTPLSRAMQVTLDRSAQRMQNNPAKVTTAELGMLSQHHPDEAIQQQAQNLLDVRRNKDIVAPLDDQPQGVRTAEAAEPLGGRPGVTTIDAQGNMGQGDAPVQFSPPRAPIDAAVKPVQDALDKEAQAQGLKQSVSTITAVDPATLPDDRTPANNGREGATTLSKSEASMLNQSAAMFGKKLVLYRQEGGTTAPDGLVLRSDPNTIYVNADAVSAHHLVVFGHELAHQMRADSPQLFEGLRKAVLKESTKGMQSEFFKYYTGRDMKPDEIAAAMKDPATRDSMTEEFVADLVGNRFAEYRTWQHLFANAGKENRSLVYRIADFITKFIDRIMSNTHFQKLATDDMVKNLASVRQNVRRALAEYSTLQGDKSMLHEASQLKASRENRVEETEPRTLVEPVVNGRADVGKVPSKAAPAPVEDRPLSNAQGSRDVEPVAKPVDRSKPTPGAEKPAPAPKAEAAPEAKPEPEVKEPAPAPKDERPPFDRAKDAEAVNDAGYTTSEIRDIEAGKRPDLLAKAREGHAWFAGENAKVTPDTITHAEQGVERAKARAQERLARIDELERAGRANELSSVMGSDWGVGLAHSDNPFEAARSLAKRESFQAEGALAKLKRQFARTDEGKAAAEADAKAPKARASAWTAEDAAELRATLDAKKVKRSEQARKGAATRYQVDTKRDSMMQALAKMGGVKKAEAVKLWGDNGNYYHGIDRALTSKGMSVDTARQRMADLGYVKSDEHGKADISDFDEKFNDGLGGDEHYTPEGVQEHAADWAQQHAEEEAERVADATPEHVQEPVNQELENGPLTTTEEAEFAEDHDADIPFGADEGHAQDQADADREFGYEPASSKLAEEDRAPDARGTEAGDTPASTQEQGDARPEFDLTGESPEEGRARLEREALLKTEQARQEREAQQRHLADEEAKNFRLTGSDSARDAEPGQDEIKPSAERSPFITRASDDGLKRMFDRTVAELGDDPRSETLKDKLADINAERDKRTRASGREPDLRANIREFFDAKRKAQPPKEVVEDTDPLKRVSDDGLKNLRDKAYDDLGKSGWKDDEARQRATDLTHEMIRRERVAEIAAKRGQVQDIHPGMKMIPEGTTVEFTFGVDKDPQRAKVVGTQELSGHGMAGVLMLPRVFDARRGREVSLLPDNILKVFQGPATAKFSSLRGPYLGKLDPAQEKAARNVGMVKDKKTVKQQLAEYSKDLGKRLEQGIAHRYAAIEDVSKMGFMQARTARGSDGTLEATLLYGKPTVDADGAYDVKINPKGGFAKVLASLDGEHNRFLLWIAAHRADELKAQGKENLFSDSDIAALKTLDQNDAAHPEREQKFKAALAEYQGYNKSILDIAEKSGLLDADLRDDMAKHMYVPFYRAMEDGTDVKGPRNVSGLVNQYAFKKLKGDKAVLNDDLLANVMQNWSHLLGAAARNRAARTTLEAAETIGVAHEVPQAQAGKGSVKVMVDGNTKFYEVDDKMLLGAVSAMYAEVPKWMAPLGWFKHALTTGVTAMPAFKVRNLIRDTITTAAISDASNPWTNLTEGIKGTAHDSQVRASMLAGGGMIRFGNLAKDGDAVSSHRLVMAGVPKDRILDSESKLKQFAEKLRSGYDAYAELGDRSENINRAALYQKLIRQGKSHMEASFAARDLLDFSDGGTNPVVQFLVQSVPFMNARIQGLFKIGQAVADPKMRGKFLAVAGAVSMASLGLLLAYQDDPDWKAREDWDRDNYWWFKAGGEAYRIPKPFEVGAIGTIAERLWELHSNPEMSGSRFAKDLGQLIGSQFNLNPIPQIVKPFVDVYSNRDSFTERPIESMAMQKLQTQDRYNVNTSMTARFLTALNLPDPMKLVMNSTWESLSPVQYDNLLKNYFGGLGQMLVGLADKGLRPLMGQPAQTPSTLRDWSAGFAEQLPSQQSRYMTDYYDNLRNIEQAYNSYHQLLKTGQPDAARAEMAQNRNLITMYSMAESAKRTESRLSIQEKRIQNSTMLSSDAKQEKLNQLTQQRNNLARSIQLRILGRQQQQQQ